MKLPLLAYASPNISQTPLVSVAKGVWYVRSNVVDTKFKFEIHGSCGSNVEETEFQVHDTIHLKVIITKPGTEKFINVWLTNNNADKSNGTDP